MHCRVAQESARLQPVDQLQTVAVDPGLWSPNKVNNKWKVQPSEVNYTRVYKQPKKLAPKKRKKTKLQN